MLKSDLIKKMILWIAVLSFAGNIFSNLAAAEKYAPKVKLPENMKNRATIENIVNGWVVPSKNEIGQPAFPGAVIVSVKQAGHMTINRKKQSTLPAVILATQQNRAGVVAFYKKELKNWQYKNEMGWYDTFWQGKGNFSGMDKVQAATIANVVIMTAATPYTDYMPEAKTTITIVYKPGN